MKVCVCIDEGAVAWRFGRKKDGKTKQVCAYLPLHVFHGWLYLLDHTIFDSLGFLSRFRKQYCPCRSGNMAVVATLSKNIFLESEQVGQNNEITT